LDGFWGIPILVELCVLLVFGEECFYVFLHLVGGFLDFFVFFNSFNLIDMSLSAQPSNWRKARNNEKLSNGKRVI
jgi:hypothetical protein